MKEPAVWAVVILLGFAGICHAQKSLLSVAPAEHQQLFADAKKAVLAEAAKQPYDITKSAESYFWLVSARLTPLMKAYRYSHDPAFLEAYLPLQEQVLSQRYIHPTKPEWNGWWTYQSEGNLKNTALIDHDTIIYFVPALMFVREVLADPALKAKYGEKAMAYLKDVEASIRAWDTRGCWVDFPDGSGWYRTISQYPDTSTGELKPLETIFSGGVVPYNKVHALFEALSIAYEITGDPWYRARMEKCCKFFRKHWRVDEKHAEWNYRDHAFPGDYESGVVGQGKTRSGAFVHTHQGYYALDVSGVVTAWDWNIFYPKEDIEKLIQTNLEFMLFGEPDAPKFKMINGSYTEEGKYGKGLLWTALAHFSQKTRDLWRKQVVDAKARNSWMWHSDALDYLLEVANPVSWDHRLEGTQGKLLGK